MKMLLVEDLHNIPIRDLDERFAIWFLVDDVGIEAGDFTGVGVVLIFAAVHAISPQKYFLTRSPIIT
jgi:hypothetical protein